MLVGGELEPNSKLSEMRKKGKARKEVEVDLAHLLVME